jgi:hypothetical protein
MTPNHDADDLGIAPDPYAHPDERSYVPDDYDEPRPTRKQLAYLRSLAQRAGQTFIYPRTASQASREIRRLRAVTPSSRVERAIERQDWAAEAAARETNCEVPVRSDEVQGYLAGATWKGRS